MPLLPIVLVRARPSKSVGFNKIFWNISGILRQSALMTTCRRMFVSDLNTHARNGGLGDYCCATSFKSSHNSIHTSTKGWPAKTRARRCPDQSVGSVRLFDSACFLVWGRFRLGAPCLLAEWMTTRPNAIHPSLHSLIHSYLPEQKPCTICTLLGHNHPQPRSFRSTGNPLKE